MWSTVVSLWTFGWNVKAWAAVGAKVNLVATRSSCLWMRSWCRSSASTSQDSLQLCLLSNSCMMLDLSMWNSSHSIAKNIVLRSGCATRLFASFLQTNNGWLWCSIRTSYSARVLWQNWAHQSRWCFRKMSFATDSESVSDWCGPSTLLLSQTVPSGALTVMRVQNDQRDQRVLRDRFFCIGVSLVVYFASWYTFEPCNATGWKPRTAPIEKLRPCTRSSWKIRSGTCPWLWWRIPNSWSVCCKDIFAPNS